MPNTGKILLILLKYLLNGIYKQWKNSTYVSISMTTFNEEPKLSSKPRDLTEMELKCLGFQFFDISSDFKMLRVSPSIPPPSRGALMEQL